MFRSLRAIEIAEGALLADIAVIFHLLTIYLPFGGEVFRIPVFIVFTVIVLRRGLYTGLLALSVALFTLAVITGLHGMTPMLIEGTGGLFLGVTMRWRVRHTPLILIGTTGGALAIYLMVGFFLFLAGQSFERLLPGMHTTYNQFILLTDAVTTRLGLWTAWRQNLYPLIAAGVDFGFRYWPLMLYCSFWLFVCPAVIVIYWITNMLVRLLGYEVRPFPGGWFGRALQRIKRRLVRWRVKRSMYRKVKAREA
ncbi:MAG: DUF2232 domain-containing protein [Ktedonobacteraceae bacterium]|nr:DUF2232 domain-containing protein [Ktedonobacteraceae bacterium]